MSTLSAYVINDYLSHTRYLTKYVTDITYDIDHLYRKDIEATSQNIAISADLVLQQEQIISAWEAGDREKMYETSRPLFEHLRQQNRITHFYFHRPDFTNLLRVHEKASYGDMIERFTLKKAAETGKGFYGVELGPYGTLTLRYVQPVSVREKILGYLELGVDIDYLIQDINEAFGVNSMVLINKNLLNRTEWEKGMSTILGRTPHWDAHKDYVTVSASIFVPPKDIDQLITAHKELEWAEPDVKDTFNRRKSERFVPAFSLQREDHLYRVGFVPLYDAANKEVGDMMILHNVTELVSSNNRALATTAGICFAIGVGLIAFFYVFIGKIENKLGRSQQQIISEIDARHAEQALHLQEIEKEHAELKESQRALRASEMRYRQLVNTAAHGIGLLNEKQDILFVNEAGAGIFGYVPQDLTGRNLAGFTSPEEAARYKQFTQFRKKGIAGYYESFIYHRDGSKRDLRISVSPVFSDTGVFENLLIIFDDITERKREEEKRRELDRQLQHTQKLESLGVLAGGIAHDFNNMLMAMMGYLELALMDMPPQDPGRNKIEMAMLSAQHAADLTRQMLAYAGKGKYQVQAVDLCNIVDENMQLFRVSIPKTVSLNLDLKHNLPKTQADPGQIQQVIMNIITNAAEAMGDQSGTITIETGAEFFDDTFLRASLIDLKPPFGNFVWFKVTDTGCGMSQDTLQRIFEPFFTTKFVGRGLGLSAVMGIVKNHNGAIIVDTQVGKGTSMQVLFPVCPEEDHPMQKAPAQTFAPAAGGSAQKGTVLLVDDEPDLIFINKSVLERLGYQVLTAVDGEEAVETFRQHHSEIQCVLLDYSMPKMDGLSAFKEMAKIQPDVKVILCSGYNKEDSVRHFGEVGIAAFIQKPYSSSVLRETLQSLLESPSAP